MQVGEGMKSNLRVTLETLKQWQKAMIRLRNGGEDLGDRQSQVEQLSQRLMTLLEQPEIAAELNRLIDQAKELPPNEFLQLQDDLRQPSRSLIDTERRSIAPLMPSSKEWERVLQATPSPDVSPKTAEVQGSEPCTVFPTDTHMVIQQFSLMQSALLKDLAASRELGRKPKKRRKRKITLGILQTTIGVALLVGNTRLFQEFPNASYILGGNALIQAMRDLLGEEEELLG